MGIEIEAREGLKVIHGKGDDPTSSTFTCTQEGHRALGNQGAKSPNEVAMHPGITRKVPLRRKEPAGSKPAAEVFLGRHGG